MLEDVCRYYLFFSCNARMNGQITTKVKMESSDCVFTIFYLIFSVGLIYPPSEFVSAGVTIPSIFQNIVGKEYESFTKYHLKKTCLCLLIYSILPLGYIILSFFLGFLTDVGELFLSHSIFWSIFASSSVAFPFLSLYQIICWSRNDFQNHPITKSLSKFCNNNTDWKSVANDIDNEFRRLDKISIETSSIVKVIATENWILKTTPLTLNAIHQSDASLVVKQAETYEFSPQSVETQYLNIEVKSERPGIESFIIRINASDFKDLKDRVARTITIMPHVKFHQSVMDQFVDIFKETIKNNPSYENTQELDQCIGCLQAQPNLKLQKYCEDVAGQPNCTNCYCRPMWCSDCMARWFASRQDQDQQNKWLSSKCACPMCRATFCMLDVCLLNEVNSEE